MLGRSKGGPSGRKRSLMRSRLRSLEERREEELRHLGGLALEMHRRGGLDEELLAVRSGELAEVEEEIEMLNKALEQGSSPDQPDSLPAKSPEQ